MKQHFYAFKALIALILLAFPVFSTPNFTPNNKTKPEDKLTEFSEPGAGFQKNTLYTWAGPSGGSWHDAANWTPNGVPGEGDDVLITSGTLVISSPVTIRSLSFNNNALTLNSTLTVTNTFTWNNGTISSTGNGNITILEDANWNLISGSSRTLDGVLTINLNGTLTYNQGFFNLGSNANVLFNNNGLFILGADLTVGSGGSGAFRMAFNNFGTFQKSGSTGTGSISSIVSLNNSGNIEVLSGRLEINSGAFLADVLTHNGSFIIDANASLFFGGGTHVLNEQSIISGPGGDPSTGTLGVFAFGGLGNPNVSINGAANFIGTLSVNTGRIILNQPVNLSGITHNSDSGILEVNAPLTISETYKWNFGTLTGNTQGIVTIQPQAVLDMTTGNSRNVTGSITINLQGTANYATGFFNTNTSSNVTLNNTGLIDIQADLPAFGGGGSGSYRMTLNNFGTFRKSAGNGVSSIASVVFLNTPGTIEVLSGQFNITSGQFINNDPFTHDGTLVIADQASLYFAGGNHILSSQSVVSGPGGQPTLGTLGIFANAGLGTPVLTLEGSVNVAGLISVANGIFRINQPYNFPKVTMNSGTLELNATLTIANTLLWANGAIGGSSNGKLNIEQNALVDLTTGSSRNLIGSITVNQEGTLNWTQGFFENGIGAESIIFNNSGLFNMQGDLRFGGGGSGYTIFLNNSGTIRKSAGTGTGSIANAVQLTNLPAGRIEILSGRFDLVSSQSNPVESSVINGIIELANSSTLGFTGARYILGSQGVIRGTGGTPTSGQIILYSNAAAPNLTIEGTILSNGTISQSSGTFTLAETGILRGNISFSRTGGTFLNNGTISPGSPIGTFAVTGAFPMSSSTAKLAVELGGNQPGVTHDQLTVSGAATLTGTVDITLSSGFFPSPQQEFTILNAGSISGTFQNVTFPDLGPGNQFAALYDGTNVKVKYTGSDITPGTTYTWVGPSTGGDWHTAANWSPVGVPGFNDEAIILAGEVAVVNVIDPVVVKNITNNSILVLNNSLTVSDTFNWLGGTIRGSSEGALNILSGAQFLLNFGHSGNIGGSLVFNLEGTTLWSSGFISTPFGDDQIATINNSGLFELQGDLFFGIFNTFRVHFNNTGVLRKTAGSGTGTLQSSVKFENSGIVEVLTGSLQILSGSFNGAVVQEHAGSFLIADEASFVFNGGTHTLLSNATVTGPLGQPKSGTLTVNNGVITFNNPITSNGLISGTGGTAILNNIINTQNANLRVNATFQINSEFTVTDVFNWEGGTIRGSSTGFLNIPSDAQFLLNFDHSGSIGGQLSFNLQGTTFFSAGFVSTPFGGSDIAIINNTGLFEMQGDLGFGTATELHFNNTGVFRKASGSGAGLLHGTVIFENAGITEILSGKLTINSGSFNPTSMANHTGVFKIEDQATLELGGRQTLTQSAIVTGNGTLALNALTFTNNGTISPGNPIGTFTVNGVFPMSSSTAKLAVELGGNQPGVTHDQLTVSGTATLAGTVDITLSGGFFPSPGQEFTILTAASIAGTFQNVNVPNLGPGNQFVAVYSTNEVKIRYEGNVISPPETYTWNGSQNTDWFNPLNWTPAGVPDLNDQAIINTGNLQTVVINDDVAVGDLTIVNTTLILDGDLTVSGTLTWGESLITGQVNSTINIPQGALLLFASGTHRLGGAITLNNSGTMRLQNGSLHAAESPQEIVMNNMGLFDMQGDFTIGTFNNSFFKLNNSGVFRKSSGTGTGFFQASLNFTNSGTFEILSGTLQLISGLINPQDTIIHSGTIIIADDSRVIFAGGSHHLTETGVIKGTGEGLSSVPLIMQRGSLVLDGELLLGGPVTLSESRLTVNKNYGFTTLNQSVISVTTFNVPYTLQNLSSSGSNIIFNESLTITGTFNLAGSGITGQAGDVLNLSEGSQLIISNGLNSISGDLIINLNGTTIMNGGDLNTTLPSYAIINNNGTFEMQGDNVIGAFHHYSQTFNNNGIFRKIGGTGTAFFQASTKFLNPGTFEILSGTVQFVSGLANPDDTNIHSGDMIIADDARVIFAGGSHHLTETGVIKGTGEGLSSVPLIMQRGSLVLDGELLLGGPVTLSESRLILNKQFDFTTLNQSGISVTTFNVPYTLQNITSAGSNIIFTESLTVTGTFNWAGSGVSGQAGDVLNLPAGSQLNISTGQNIIFGNITINLNGTTSMTGGDLGSGNATNVVINNTGLFDMQGDFIIGTFNAFWGTFNNSGTFRKSAGSGEAFIQTSLRLNNTGRIEVLSGTLTINSGGFDPSVMQDQFGVFSISEGTTLKFAAGNHRLTESGTITGTGILALAGGSFTNNGTLSPGDLLGTLSVTGNFPMSSNTARLAIELGGDQPGVTHDNLNITGSASLAGTLDIALIEGFLPSPDQEFIVLEAQTISGEFENITFPDFGPEREFVAIYSGNSVTVRYEGSSLTIPVAVNDTVSTPFNTPVSINVLFNDISPGGEPLNLISVSEPANGTAVISANDQAIYTPNEGFFGQDQFTYTISNSLGETDTGLVVVTVNELVTEPEPPVAINDIAETDFNTPVDVNVLLNDFDPDGGEINIISVSQPLNGTVEIISGSIGEGENLRNQYIRYTPGQDFFGQDQFSYTIMNDSELTATAQVSITVNEPIINNPPVAVSDTARTVLNLPVVINILSNDFEPDGDEIFLVSFDQVGQSGGTVIELPGNLLEYTPVPGFTGTDRFNYSITDGLGGNATGLVVVEVFPIRFEVVLTGAPGTRAMAIDEDGSIAGNLVGQDGSVKGFYQNTQTLLVFETGSFGSQIYGLAGDRMSGLIQVNDSTGLAHYFKLDGSIEAAGNLGGDFSLGYAINHSGQMTGVSKDNQKRYRAFLKNQTESMSDISAPGFRHSTGFSINTEGQVAGMVMDVNGLQRAWVSENIKTEVNSRAYHINNLGDAVGSIKTQSGISAAYWTGTSNAFILPSGGDVFAEAYGINDAGWITGISGPGAPVLAGSKAGLAAATDYMHTSYEINEKSTASLTDQKAVIWISGTLFHLNELIDPSLGWVLLEASAVNNSGQVAGTGILNGQIRAFVLHPIDEVPPLTADLSHITAQNTELQVDIGHLNGSGAWLVYLSQPENGQAEIINDALLRYKPNSGFIGTDRLRYALSNGRSVSYGTITIKVEPLIDPESNPSLAQNYPNPFRNSTTIQLNLPEPTVIRLDVYDLTGKNQLEVFSGWIEAGQHYFSISSSQLGSGTFIYRLVSPEATISRKMTIFK